MLWLILRTTLYLALFGFIWYGGQLYVSQELNKGLLQTSPHAIFVNGEVFNDNTTANQTNGSITYPFTTIEQALQSAKISGTNTIIISDGIYNEKLILPEDVILFGNGSVVVSQEGNTLVDTITTGNNNKLLNLTIAGGDNAVKIPYNTATTFVNVTMTKADDFGLKMEGKDRPKTPDGEKEPVIYDVFDKTDAEIANMPLVRFNNVTVTENDNQGLYLKDGRVEIYNSQVIKNGEEGIDLHPHMFVTIENTNASENGESGLETEIYDNIITIKNSTFNNNIKNGLAFITSHGIGNITIIDSTVTNNQRFGIRCAVHKNKPKKPRPFFSSLITKESNIIKDNVEADIAERCYTF